MEASLCLQNISTVSSINLSYLWLNFVRSWFCQFGNINTFLIPEFPLIGHLSHMKVRRTLTSGKNLYIARCKISCILDFLSIC